jgi:hypothetical protein
VKNNNQKKGQILIQVLVFGSIGVFFMGSLVSWGILNLKASKRALNNERLIQIAEAGTDYYRWHLAHAPEDYQDGQGVEGPYVHDFQDKDGNSIGQFILDITPPVSGSTVVTVKSTGKINTDLEIERSITTQLAKASWARYAVVANVDMRFGEGTEIFGPVHSNNGIRFDGVAHNVVTSSVEKYYDPDHSGPQEFGVHTHLYPQDPYPPSSVPIRTDVFEAGRQFPVPTVDFDGITMDLADMEDNAQESGFYRNASGSLGYHIVLRTDDTFNLYKVNSLASPPYGCYNSQDEDGWGTWSINTQEFLGNYDFPENGIMFFEDDIFIDGQIDTARLTIVAAYLPDSPYRRKTITINEDLLYTNYNGEDVIGLIAQDNINIGLISSDDLRIDAALVAQNGRIGRYYYSSSCFPYHIRDSLTLWGMIATNQRYGFAYTDDTGYQIRNLNYDGYLLYNPPSSFPLTSWQYMTLSWEETD